MLKFIPVVSSNIEAVAYSPESREMQVRFKGGAVYTHADVPVFEHAKFISAQSKGQHYSQHFRGKHNARKVGVTAAAHRRGVPDAG